MKPVAARLRLARAADLDELLALEQHFAGDRMSRRAFRHLLGSAAAMIWLAQASGQTLGAIVLLTQRKRRRARIYSVVVSPAARGQGLGKRLVQRAEREARQLGYAGVSLEVRQDNQAARALYAALGYVVHAELPAYYDDGADGLRLHRDFVAGK